MSATYPSYLRASIEAIRCRMCGAEGASCIEPRSRAVSVRVVFDDRECEFCYERVHDYFEAYRRSSGWPGYG